MSLFRKKTITNYITVNCRANEVSEKVNEQLLIASSFIHMKNVRDQGKKRQTTNILSQTNHQY